MIERILPPEVRVAEAREDPPDVALFPAEEALVRRAVDKRRREFGTGRWCARRALRELGVADAPLLRDERGAPRWPDGVLGSITHCDGYRAAAVVRAGRWRALGIDAEPDSPLPGGVGEVIALPEERRALAALGTDLPWDRILFSAKESVYKAWYPLTRAWLEFEQARVELDPGAPSGPSCSSRPRWSTASR
ncbi:4'-phosphopantetheinyl transferase family protein [Saccharopolyspora sp. CA-218241]|uniref:4'-phosphopantetheinyl transferase family protein n=1 Tax=Saccharopolyspora sp. CA-218241 TaxID=3240027 RepID=UPI003D95E5D6